MILTPSPEGEGYSENNRNINAQKIINIEKFLERARESLFLKRGSRTIPTKTVMIICAICVIL